MQEILIRAAVLPCRPEEILLVNPNTGTCPLFRSRRDAEITIGIYKRVPSLAREPEENPWGMSFMRMFDMTNDSGMFATADSLKSEGWTLDGNVFIKGGDGCCRCTRLR